MSKSFPCMNDLFREIPISPEDKIYEHIQVSFLLGSRTKGNLACCSRFCRFSRRSFLKNQPIPIGKGWPIEAV